MLVLFTDNSGQSIGPILKCQAFQEDYHKRGIYNRYHRNVDTLRSCSGSMFICFFGLSLYLTENTFCLNYEDQSCREVMTLYVSIYSVCCSLPAFTATGKCFITLLKSQLCNCTVENSPDIAYVDRQTCYNKWSILGTRKHLKTKEGLL